MQQQNIFFNKNNKFSIYFISLSVCYFEIKKYYYIYS